MHLQKELAQRDKRCVYRYGSASGITSQVTKSVKSGQYCDHDHTIKRIFQSAQNMSAPKEAWFIVKNPSGHCEILSEQMLEQENDSQTESKQSETETEALQWGPFETQNQAIAKRVGLIRAGKCQPAS